MGAGEAEALCSEVASFSTYACPEINEGGQITVSVEDETNFDMDRFKRESSTAPLTLLPTPSVTTYPMFNSAPYGSPALQPKKQKTADDKGGVSASLGFASSSRGDVGDSTTEDDEPSGADGAYFPSQQRQKKKTLKVTAVAKGRSRTVSQSSDTDGEEMTCWTNDRSILASNAAAVEERIRAAEEAEKLVTEEKARAEEEARKVSEAEAKIRAEEANKAAEEEERRIEEEVRKKMEAQEKAKEQALKRKEGEAEAKARAEEERKKAEAKKLA